MTVADNKVIHRFIRDISEYEEDGEYYSQIIPLDTQVYAQYTTGTKTGLYYVLGDGEHTYTEIRSGKGSVSSAKEYPVYDGGGSTPLDEYRKAVDQDVIDDKIRENVNNVKSDLKAHVENTNNPHNVTKEQIGLGKVDNTSDLEKPVSNATHLELDKKADKDVVKSEVDNINKRITEIVYADIAKGTVILTDDDTRNKYEVYTTTKSDEVIKNSINEAIDIKESVINFKSNNDEGTVYTKEKVDELIPDVSSFITKDVDDLTNYTKTSDLATVAITGSYNDLTDKPELPIASADTLGAIKVGSGLSITADGVLNATGTTAGVSSVNGETGDVLLDSSNLMYGERTIQSVLDELLYVAPKVTSFTGGGTFEVGSSVDATLKWTVNKTIASQSLNQGIGSLDASLRSYSVTGITSNRTYTITVTDDKGTNASANTSFTFYNYRYWGVNANDTLTDDEIKVMSKELSGTRAQTRTFDCTGGKYFYFVIPTSLCSGISFKVDGLSFTDMNIVTRIITNTSGAEVSYNIYRSNNIQHGNSIPVQVS